MRKGFYCRLALQNICKNGRFYIPYILAGIFTVAGFYNTIAINADPAITQMPGAQHLKMIMFLGAIILAIFSAVFLFYTNSFLMKRRTRELGLYNVLGMEKRHIAGILLWECLISGAICIAGGLLAGILLSKLLLLILFRVLFFTVHFGFSIRLSSLGITAALFACIFLLNLLANLVKIGRARPVELLQSGRAGEREPKTKWLLVAAGLLALGGGYYIAIATENPIKAIPLFFVAVLLVIIATYCLFTAGSIALLKLMRRNRNYYYQPRHFVAVSGMLHRMKQNAVGLANICILCTMVLVMVSATVCLFAGTEDAIANRYPYDISFDTPAEELPDRDAFRQACVAAVDAQGLTMENIADIETLSFSAARRENRFEMERANIDSLDDLTVIGFVTWADYVRAGGAGEAPGTGELLAWRPRGAEALAEITIGGRAFTIGQWLEDWTIRGNYFSKIFDCYMFVVPDRQTLQEIEAMQRAVYGEAASSITWSYAFDLTGTDEEQTGCFDAIQARTGAGYGECRAAGKASFYAMYGGFMFLGMFLGTIFLMATALIIYYKQLSEGYLDRERFRIMQQVGLDRREIRKMIRSQILIVFFLPLLAAGVHLAAAFPIVTRLLAVMNLTNSGLFLLCAAGTLLVFAAVYLLIYSLTAKSYYRIVSG